MFNLGSVFVFSITIIAIGFFSLYGYINDIPRLYTWIPSATPMAPNTAICFILAGLSLIILLLTIKNIIKKITDHRRSNRHLSMVHSDFDNKGSEDKHETQLEVGSIKYSTGDRKRS